jgi:hypothetical protein
MSIRFSSAVKNSEPLMHMTPRENSRVIMQSEENQVKKESMLFENARKRRLLSRDRKQLTGSLGWGTGGRDGQGVFEETFGGD